MEYGEWRRDLKQACEDAYSTVLKGLKRVLRRGQGPGSWEAPREERTLLLQPVQPPRPDGSKGANAPCRPLEGVSMLPGADNRAGRNKRLAPNRLRTQRILAAAVRLAQLSPAFLHEKGLGSCRGRGDVACIASVTGLNPPCLFLQKDALKYAQ